MLTFLFASAIALAPEHVVGAPRFATPGVQDIAMASFGSETLVAMQTGDAIFVQRLDSNAQPQTPHGTPVVRGAERLGGVAAGPSGYVLFWATQHDVWSTLIGAAGDVSPPQRIATTVNNVLWPAIASNGSGFLAVWSDATPNTERAMAARLDSRGVPIGDAFPLTERGGNAAIQAIASDGRDYLVAIEHPAGGGVFVSEFVPVSASGEIGTPTAVSFFARALVHTANGYVALWDTPAVGGQGGFTPARTYAVAVDTSGHLGTPLLIDEQSLESAATNGTDIMVITTTAYYARTSFRARRAGDTITAAKETALQFPRGFTRVGALHTGDYFAVAQSPLVFSVVKPAPANALMVDQPLLTFAVPQAFPSVSGKFVAWRESSGGEGLDAAGSVLRAAVDSKSYEIAAPSVGSHALAANAQRALIVWTELRLAGEAPHAAPMTLKGRALALDGTLSAPFVIGAGEEGLFTLDPINLGAATATASGFVVVWSQNAGAQRALFDANGTLLGTASLQLPSAFEMRVAPRRDGFLLLASGRAAILSAPFHADGTPAGPQQTLATSGNSLDIAGDGNGHFLALWIGDGGIISQPLDDNGAPAGAARLLGDGQRPRVTWNGSAFMVASGANIGLVGRDGAILEPLTARLPEDATSTEVDGASIAYLRNATDIGVGNSNVVFERSAFATRRRPAGH